MGLVDMINARNDEVAAAEMAEMTQQQERRDEIKQRRDRIVSEGVAKFAADNGCDVVELSRKGSDRFFLIGDLVFMVRQERLLDNAKAEALTPSEVLWQHIVYLVGYDVTDRIAWLRVGVLWMLRFAGVLKTYNSGYGKYLFDHSMVITLLYPADGD